MSLFKENLQLKLVRVKDSPRIVIQIVIMLIEKMNLPCILE